MHASPDVISKFRTFQDNPTTSTSVGRARLIKAVQQVRRELGHRHAPDEDIAVLLFGNAEPTRHFCSRCRTVLGAGERFCADCGGVAGESVN